jgi:hypothetical protein
MQNFLLELLSSAVSFHTRSDSSSVSSFHCCSRLALILELGMPDQGSIIVLQQTPTSIFYLYIQTDSKVSIDMI